MDVGETLDIKIEVAKQDPDIIYFHGILSKEECEHLIKISEPHLKRSRTFSSGNDSRRTSSSAFANPFYHDKVLRKVMHRCSILSGFPVEHIELPQIVRYHSGEQFMRHQDNYESGKSLEISGQRDYTFFIYLNEPEKKDQTGGETYFSYIDFKAKPKTGTAVFWRNVIPTTGKNENYERIAHAGLPPQNWTKYGMNVWVRHKKWIG